MALVTFSGYPASGKSTRAAQLKSNLEALLPDHLSVVLVSDESLNILPSVYDGLLAFSLKFWFQTFPRQSLRETRPWRPLHCSTAPNGAR
jgi:hypothetical protein